MTVDESFVVSTYVVPFYMSRLDADEVRQLAALARAASVDEILWMIDNAGWREQRVGAYFALVRAEPAIGPALLAAIPRTHGTYGLHPLVTAAVLLCAADAIPALHTHQQRVNAVGYRGDPGSGFVAVALEHLGADPLHPATDDDRAQFERMLQLAEQIRSI